MAQVAIVDGSRRIGYAELDRRVHARAAALLAGGLRPGDHCAIVAGNRIEYVEALLALSSIGAPFVCLDPRATPAEQAYVIEHADARMVLRDADLDVPPPPGTLALPEVDEAAPLRIAYTSGTTGRPKGVIVSRRAQAAMFRQFTVELELTADDRTLIPGPLHAIGPFVHALLALHLGATLVLQRRFDPVAVLETIAAEQITNTFMVPTMFELLMAELERRPGHYDVSSLRRIVSGSAPRRGRTRRRMAQHFPQAAIHEVYGSTEGGLNTNLRPQDGHEDTVGRPGHGCAVRVLDGVLEVRSLSLADGYYKDPEETARRFTADGWFKTSDLARVADDGFVTLLERADDMIITGGVNVHPSEVEDVLSRHPDLLEAAVVGVDDERWGQVVTAVVVPKGGRGVEAEEVIAFCRGELARHKCPKVVRVTDALPRNGAGKVLRRQLRAQPESAR